MAYKCLDCGHIFENGEQKTIREDRGEFWGMNCAVQESVCPLCNGEYEETSRCKICHSEHLDEELSGGVCEDCINKYKKDFEICYQIASQDKVAVEINGLLASLLEPHIIEQALKNYIKTKWQGVDCSEYIDTDKDWFGEKLAKEVKR